MVDDYDSRGFTETPELRSADDMAADSAERAPFVPERPVAAGANDFVVRDLGNREIAFDGAPGSGVLAPNSPSMPLLYNGIVQLEL